MVTTRGSVSRALFPAALAFTALRGRHGPWAKPDAIPKTLAAGAAGLASMAYGAYKTTTGLRRLMYAKRRSKARRMYRRKPFGRRRRRAPRVVGRYRGGQRYTTRKASLYKPLNTNVRRNDYRTLRVSKTVGEIEVGNDTSLVENNFRYVCHLDHWTTDWSREINAYDEFKLTNIQFVIEPRFTSSNTGINKTLQVPQGELPYLAVRQVLPANLKDAFYTADEVRRTPGFRFCKIGQKGRIIVNCKPTLREVMTFEVGGTQSNLGMKSKAMPYVKTTSTTKAMDVAAIEIRKPVFESGSTSPERVWKYDVKCYATIRLRGNQDELIQPY